MAVSMVKNTKEKVQKVLNGDYYQNALALGLIALAVVLRLLPHPANFAPVGAIALFGGAYLGRRQAIYLPVLIMVISDVFLGLHSTIMFTWGSYLLIALLGTKIRERVTAPRVAIGAVGSALLFYFVTNFGVWAVTPLYTKTFSGLLDCYVMALPFFRATLLSDLAFASLLFGAYESAKLLFKKSVAAN